jgi:hypothetical protein
MRSLTLKPLGEKLANTFPLPRSGLAIHNEDAKLPLEELKEWGLRAHVSCFTDDEGSILAEALQGGEETDFADHVRWTALRLLAGVRRVAASNEASILQGLAKTLQNGGGKRLKAAPEFVAQITAVLQILEPFETLYQGILFLFESLRGAASDGGAPPLTEIARSEELQQAARALAGITRQLHPALTEAKERSPAAVREIETVFQESGILALADAIAQQTDDHVELLRTILHHHKEVMSGRLDRDLQKASWLRLDFGTGKIYLTAQRYQLSVDQRPSRWTDIPRLSLAILD